MPRPQTAIWRDGAIYLPLEYVWLPSTNYRTGHTHVFTSPTGPVVHGVIEVTGYVCVHCGLSRSEAEDWARMKVGE